MDELLQYLNSLPKDERGPFAVRCGTTDGYIRRVASSQRTDSPIRLGESICINIERETNGVITCESLRPDVDWAYLRKTCKQRAA